VGVVAVMVAMEATVRAAAVAVALSAMVAVKEALLALVEKEETTEISKVTTEAEALALDSLVEVAETVAFPPHRTSAALATRERADPQTMSVPGMGASQDGVSAAAVAASVVPEQAEAVVTVALTARAAQALAAVKAAVARA